MHMFISLLTLKNILLLQNHSEKVLLMEMNYFLNEVVD